MTSSPGLSTIDFDDLFSGAVKGWLAALCGFAVWVLIRPSTEYGFLLIFLGFGAYFSLWYLGLLIIVGVPCFDLLRRLRPRSSPVTWGATGGVAFGTATAVVVALLNKHFADFFASVILAALAGVGGGVTFYAARKAAV